jgi:hypothetical protein
MALVAVCLTGCSLLPGGSGGTSVFDVEPGQCFLAEEEPKAQLSELDRVDCEEVHHQEAYARVAYQQPDDAAEDVFPGDEALNVFADGACATEFDPYVGVGYLDSSLFFTYLVPSARSWEEDDREVVCFITAAGAPLEGSVKGTAR